MWPSAQRNPHRPDWRCERDLVGETAAAVRAHGMRFGTYYCAGVDGTFGGVPIVDLESMIAALPQTDEYLGYVTGHWHELIDRYEPSLAWNDYAFPGPREHLRELLRAYLERVPDGVINNRFQERVGTHLEPCPTYSDFTTPEYTVEAPPTGKWEACRSIGLSFGYNALESERTYLSATELIHLFVDVVARGGNLLLNVNPTATGAIPWEEAQRLLALGWWLREHGEAIFATRPWERHAGLTLDAQPIRYTRSADAVHAVVLGTPPGDAVELDVALADGAEATIPGHGSPLPWTRTSIGVRIELPQAPPERPAISVRLAPAGAVSPA
jgi:alpha-L-fucosidase